MEFSLTTSAAAAVAGGTITAADIAEALRSGAMQGTKRAGRWYTSLEALALWMGDTATTTATTTAGKGRGERPRRVAYWAGLFG